MLRRDECCITPNTMQHTYLQTITGITYTIETTYSPGDTHTIGGWHVRVLAHNECLHDAHQRTFRTEHEAIQNAQRVIDGIAHAHTQSTCFLPQIRNND